MILYVFSYFHCFGEFIETNYLLVIYAEVGSTLLHFPKWLREWQGFEKSQLLNSCKYVFYLIFHNMDFLSIKEIDKFTFL